MIDTLVNKDFIKRQKHLSDRRSHTLVYSAKADKIMSQLIPIIDDFIGKIRGNFEPHELEQFLSVLSELRSMGCLEELQCDN